MNDDYFSFFLIQLIKFLIVIVCLGDSGRERMRVSERVYNFLFSPFKMESIVWSWWLKKTDVLDFVNDDDDDDNNDDNDDDDDNNNGNNNENLLSIQYLSNDW